MLLAVHQPDEDPEDDSLSVQFKWQYGYWLEENRQNMGIKKSLIDFLKAYKVTGDLDRERFYVLVSEYYTKFSSQTVLYKNEKPMDNVEQQAHLRTLKIIYNLSSILRHHLDFSFVCKED
jgi:hypothetical protein